MTSLLNPYLGFRDNVREEVDEQELVMHGEFGTNWMLSIGTAGNATGNSAG